MPIRPATPADGARLAELGAPCPPPASCLVAEDGGEDGGEVAGASWPVSWPEDDGSTVVLICGIVDPAHRGRGHGTALLRAQEARAPESVVLAGNISDEGSAALLRDNGYRVAFTVVVLRRAVTAEDVPPLPAGFTTRPLRPEHLPLLHAVIVECFTGSPHGMAPLDAAAWTAAARDTDLWVVAWHGDEVAGLVTNEREADGTADSPWVAVRPAYRRRGLARALLARSVAALHAAGIAEATINTIAENADHAVTLYERAGYAVVERRPRYRKLRSAAAAPEHLRDRAQDDLHVQPQ